MKWVKVSSVALRRIGLRISCCWLPPSRGAVFCLSMELVIFIILTAAAGAYFTSIGCRLAQARHRRAGWPAAVFGALVTAVLAALTVGQGDLFHPGRWDDWGVSIWIPMMVLSVAAAGVALLASTLVVAVFSARFQKECGGATGTGADTVN